MPMRMKRLLLEVVVTLALAASSERARAGVLGGLARDLTSGAAQGALEKIEPVLASTINDVDARLEKHETHIGNVLGGVIDDVSKQTGVRLDQVDGILEKRLLQVQLGVDDVLDHGLDKIDGTARKNIARIDDVLAKRIAQVDDTVQKVLTKADEILDKQIANVGRTVTNAIDQTDGVLTARLDQLDEIAGRRLGNVDVIASKQRLGLERTITRSAWLIGLIVFVVFLLRALWKEYADGRKKLREAPHGQERARAALALLGAPLLKHAVVGAAVAALLALVPERLPMAAVKEQQELVDKHAAELEKSLAQLDWTRVRFHASQLEFLDAGASTRYQAMAAKADLLRDVLGKATALATTSGLVATLAKLEALDRLQDGRPDPDARTVRAMILWQRGTTKVQEHEAATLAARALWSSPRGFTLAPMARLLVEAYLHAPAAAPSGASDDSESMEGLAAALQLETPLPAGSPFEGIVTLFHLMQTLDETSSASYVKMIEAQARVKRDDAEKPRRASLGVDVKARNDAAEEIVRAWTTFDEALRSNDVLVANPSVLGIFRLDDVLLTHALWFTTQPTTVQWPLRLSALPNDAKGKRLKLAIAPARAVWARRYVGLLQGPARELVELQEAQRFEELEEQALRFEASYGAIALDVAVEQEQARDRRGAKRTPSADRVAGQVEAVSAAAALGLYADQGKDKARASFAITLSAQLAEVKTKVEAAIAGVQTGTDAALAKKEAEIKKTIGAKRAGLHDALHEKANELLEKLRANVNGRPARLI
jgi:hypothetical protein